MIWNASQRASLTIYLWGALASVGCKSVGSKEGSQLQSDSNSMPSDVECGPHKKFYFHWMDQKTASVWLKQAGAESISSMKKLTPPPKELPEVNEKLLEGIFEATHHGVTYMAGPGIYLSATAGGSQEFGDTLLLFRVTGSDGKGSPCSNQEASQFKALNVQSTGAARTTLPFLVEYLPERPWYIIPRAPQTSNGEHAYFDLPHQGDAVQVAEELIFGKSESELLHNLANVLILTAQGYDADHPGEPMCRTTQPSASMDFLQELNCTAIPQRFSKLLATVTKSKLSQADFHMVKQLTQASSILNANDLTTALTPFTQQVKCIAGPDVFAARDLKGCAEADVLCPFQWNKTKALDDCDLKIQLRKTPSGDAFSGVKRLHGRLQVKALLADAGTTLSFRGFSSLEETTGLDFDGITLEDCDTDMALNKVNNLWFSGAGVSCLPRFPKVEHLDSLRVAYTAKLPRLSSFEAIKSIKYLAIQSNGSLIEINSLKGITSIEKLNITNNGELSDIKFLINPVLYPTGPDHELSLYRNKKLDANGQSAELIKLLQAKGWTIQH